MNTHAPKKANVWFWCEVINSTECVELPRSAQGGTRMFAKTFLIVSNNSHIAVDFRHPSKGLKLVDNVHRCLGDVLDERQRHGDVA